MCFLVCYGTAALHQFLGLVTVTVFPCRQLASSAQQEELHRIQAERDTLKARVSSVEAQLAEALSASQAASASVAELQQQLDAERESKAATVAELQARLEALAGEKDALDQQVAEVCWRQSRIR
jgi:chromosome segregation ATPase